MRFLPLVVVLTLMGACQHKPEPADTATGATGDTNAVDTTAGETADTHDTTESADDTTGGDTTADTHETAMDPLCETWGTPLAMGTVGDDTLDEISGIAPSQQNPGILWVLEDHLGDPQLVALDTAGDPVGTLIIDGVNNIDWEDLALTRCETGWCLWIADTGNNNFDRTELPILRVTEPLLTGAVSFTIVTTPETFLVRYPDEVQDSEGLAITPDGLPLLFTKRDDGVSRVYLDPVLDPVNVTDLVLVDTITVTDESNGGSRTTSADMWPDGSRVLVRTYGYLWEYRAVEGVLIGAMDAGRRVAPYASEPQGESVAYDPAQNGYWQVSEGLDSTLWFTGCADGLDTGDTGSDTGADTGEDTANDTANDTGEDTDTGT